MIERLEPLVGRWRSSGRTVDGVQIAGTDAYEWFPGGGFLVHHVDVQMGEDRVQVIEMIGDPDSTDGGRLRMRAFDNQGGYGEMRASVDDAGVWTFAGDTMRTTLTIDSDGKTMAAKWERSPDGATWVYWMDMEFAREA
jgi:hypothetical protein